MFQKQVHLVLKLANSHSQFSLLIYQLNGKSTWPILLYPNLAYLSPQSGSIVMIMLLIILL